MKKFLKTFLFVLALLIGLLYISDYSYLLNAVSKIYFNGHTTAFLDDYKYFDNATLPPSENPQAWPLAKQYNQWSVSESLEAYHKNTGTVAFLVIKNDSLLYENYYDGYGVASKSNSFSMVKSIVSALLGKAIDEGHVKSLDQPVKDFFPELKGSYADRVTLGDLSSMSSGMEWDESYYSPLSVTTASYFVSNLDELILDQPIDIEPGKAFIYKSGATQLLGMALEKATGKKLSDYLYQSFWNPMGAESESAWQWDSEENKRVKAYCCLASNARDFARFGKLYKDHGKWNGKQLLDSTFIATSIRPRFEESPEYGYGWWLKNYRQHRVFMMRGHLGQYVITFPDLNLMVVRLGHLKGKSIDPDDPFTEDIYQYMDAALEMNQNATTS